MNANINNIDDFIYEEEEEDEEEQTSEEVYNSVTSKKSKRSISVTKQKKFLEVINVGQGDSILMRFPTHDLSHLYPRYDTYLIDTGKGNVDVTDYIEHEDGKVSIVLTHSHGDHIGGFRAFEGKMGRVQRVILPFCYNEIATIAEAITKLIGFSSASRSCSDICDDFYKIVEDHNYIRSIINEGGMHHIEFIREKMTIDEDNKIECLNPPVCLDNFDWIDDVTDEELDEIIDEEFTSKFAKDLQPLLGFYRSVRDNKDAIRKKSYREAERDFRNELRENRENSLNGFWLFCDENESPEPSLEELNSRANFLRGFLLRNIDAIHEFNEKSTPENLRALITSYSKEVHNTCIILRANYDNKYFLLTGDASKKAFNRLIRKRRDIFADYIKMPHHGSRANISSKILDAIDPKVAIISHDNGPFGSATDHHPNVDTLLQLFNRKIKILLTNDVKKKDFIMYKCKHQRDNYVQIDE